jgi:RNA polymerase sigma-70 factor (ECF subfamily)
MALPASEQELVVQAVAGDRLALERLLLLHATRLERHLVPRIPNLLRGVIDENDILQQTFLQAYRDIGSFQPRGQGSFFAWLRSIAENRLFDCIREHKRKKRGGDHKRQQVAGGQGSSVMEVLDTLSGQQGTPSQAIAREEAVHAEQIGIEGLPHDQREALQRHCLKGQTLAETAQAMGKTPGAIRALIHRAKGRLQEMLDRSAIWLSGGR